MKKFNEYLKEDFDPAIFNADGGMSINDPTVMDAINSNLEVSTSCKFRTPYNALEEIRKVLAYYKIFLPKSMFLDENHGNDVFEVSQFGEKMGMNNQGEVVTASDSPLFVYFEWSLNEKGMYDAFAALVDQEELDEILADYDAEVSDDETDLQEERSMGKVSKMLYKVVNQMKASKQSDDVDSLINHEKQGKTFTQMNEEPMPNVKKMMAAKMAKKKVSLANMNKEETEQLDEISKKKLGQYIKAASHDVATKSAATGRYADRANRARDEMKKGDYKNWPQGKKDDEFADKMFKKSWNRRKGIAKAVDKLTK